MTPWISLLVPGIGLHVFRSDAVAVQAVGREAGAVRLVPMTKRTGVVTPRRDRSCGHAERRSCRRRRDLSSVPGPKIGTWGTQLRPARAGLLVDESQQSFGFAVGAAEGDGDGVIFVDDVNGVFVLSSLLFAGRSGLKI